MLSQTHIAGITVELEQARNSATAIFGIREMAHATIEEQNAARRLLGRNAIILLTSLKGPIELKALAEGLAMVEDVQDGQVLTNTRLKERLSNFTTIIESCAVLIKSTPVSNIDMIVPMDSAQYIKSLHSRLSKKEDRKHIVLALLNYLLLPEFASGACRDSSELKTRLDQFPFYRYAARFWAQHVRDMAAQEIRITYEVVSPLVKDLLQMKSPTQGKLAAALQICDLTETELLRYGETANAIALPISVCSSVSRLQVASRYGFSWVVSSILDFQPESVHDRDARGMSTLQQSQ